MTNLKQADLFRKLDETLGSFLYERGFKGRAFEYFVRPDSGGQETVHIADGKRVRANTHFGVVLSYEPDYLLHFIDEVYQLGAGNPSKGAVCPFYLTPIIMTRHEKFWPCHDASALQKTLALILPAFESVGVPWLMTLRDRRTFAESVDPVAASSAAVAFEACGDFAKARAFWTEVKRREIGILEQIYKGRIEKLDLLGARLLVYSLQKLGEDQPLQDRLQSHFKFQISTSLIP